MTDDQQIATLKILLKDSVSKVYAEQPNLLHHEGIEQAIVFRVGAYLHDVLKGNPAYSVLNLDCEYNKNLDETKRTANYPDGIRPDLLIHRRGVHDQNKLAVEFKGWWNTNHTGDIQKLKDLTNPEYDYKYILGAFVCLEKNEPSYRFFIGGNEEADNE